MNILIIGSKGFIGSNLSDCLQLKGHTGTHTFRIYYR